MRFSKVVAGAALIALLVAIGAAEALAAPPVWYYLVGDGEPIGSLSTSEPPSIPLPNYDPQRDSEPGLLIKKASGEAGETDGTKYQQWEVAAPPGELTISPVVLWAALKDFDADKTGRLGVYLLDCDASCRVIDTVYNLVNGATWSKLTVSFSGPHTFAAGHRLAIKVVVQADSDDDMWLAYGTWDYDSSIRVRASNVSATTTTVTTTTTSPPTTTTTSPPTTTTTSPPTTSTTIPGPTFSTSSTTTTIGPLSSPTTTATTVESPETDSDQTVVAAGGRDDPNLPPPSERLEVVEANSARMAITKAMPLAPPVSPQEGLQVAYNAAVQTIATNSIPFLALLLVGGLLFLARLSDDDDGNFNFGRPDPGSWWFYG